MKAGDLKRRLSRNANRVLRFGVYGSVAAASFLVARAWAGPASEGTAAKADVVSEEAAARVAPNYALEERFLPDQVSKLVFDLVVTPPLVQRVRQVLVQLPDNGGDALLHCGPVEEVEDSVVGQRQGGGGTLDADELSV